MSFKSTQNIPQEATQQKKLPKVAARYMEVEQFKDSDHHKGYFCYNCTFFVKPHHCAIVTDEGLDTMGRSSGVIAPHGLCSLWTPNEKEIHGDSSHRGGSSTEASLKNVADESTPGVSASFSCEICSKSFQSREELRQHTIANHSTTTWDKTK
jgi:stress-induced morphogen